MEVPDWLFKAACVYIAGSSVVLAALGVLVLPTIGIVRRRGAFFYDWNESLKAPWLFWHIGGRLFRFQELLGNYVLPAPQRVCDLAFAHFRSQVLITVSELGVPDLLHANGPMTGAQLATATGAHRDYLERVLRAAARMGVVSVTQPHGRARAHGDAHAAPGRFDLGGAAYGLTQLSAVLCESHPNSVKHMVALFGDHYGPAGCLLEGVRRGVTPYEVYSGGKSHWDHMAEVPALQERFNKAMTQFNNLAPVEAVFMAYPRLGSYSRVVDVGGGLGAFLAAALQRYPRLTGALFDLPAVIGDAVKAWGEEGGAARRGMVEAGRVRFHRGSFFEEGKMPRATSDGELFVLREILHDWSDADSLKILKEVRAAIGRHLGSRLLLIEAVISEQLPATASARINGDVHMMVQYGDAKERTEAQFGALLAAAGFRMGRVIPTKGLFFLVEAAPV